MAQQSNMIYKQQLALNSDNIVALKTQLQAKYYMIIGEGSVFLGLMLLGIFQVRKAFKKESELLARQKTFLHSVTHEFKSPIASLRLQIETLLKRNLPTDMQQQALNNALEDTDRLDQLLEKILVAARIDNKELPIYPENLNISEKIKETITQVNRAYPARKIEQNISPNVYSYVDAWALSSITTNLIENALLYSAQDKTVAIELAQKGNNAVLEIKDLGVGIPADERKKVFEKFYRLNSTSKGTGLGLYLVDYFVKKHKGQITIKDNTPQGSIFEVVLPGKKV